MPETLSIELEDAALTLFVQAAAPFHVLEEQEVAALLPLFERARYAAGECIFSEHDPARNLFLVEDGTLKLTIPGRNEKSFVRGDIFGEIGVIDDSFRSGSIQAQSDAILLRLAGADLFDDSRIPAATALKIFRELTRKIISYLRSIEQTSTRELIRDGESDRLEFKSSLRWNLHTRKFDKDIEHACLKSVAAFLNSEGGTLIVGVNDRGEIVGLQQDKFPNEDRIMLHFTNLVRERMSTYHVSFLDYTVELINGRRILRVDCNPATRPAYLRHSNNEFFYVRTGPASTELRISEVHDYIVRRFQARPA